MQVEPAAGKGTQTGGGALVTGLWRVDVTERRKRMKRSLLMTLATFTVLVLSASAAQAQSGHFVGTPTCTDNGTTYTCSGKVAGLGGTTFEITTTAEATAETECTNPAGNVAPGQTFDFDAASDTGPLPTPRNGAFRFSLTTVNPAIPADACPNPRWTASIVDVTFGDVTVSLFEDNVLSDQITVPVS
jgi:hypothetical protein